MSNNQQYGNQNQFPNNNQQNFQNQNQMGMVNPQGQPQQQGMMYNQNYGNRPMNPQPGGYPQNQGNFGGNFPQNNFPQRFPQQSGYPQGYPQQQPGGPPGGPMNYGGYNPQQRMPGMGMGQPQMGMNQNMMGQNQMNQHMNMNQRFPGQPNQMNQMQNNQMQNPQFGNQPTQQQQMPSQQQQQQPMQQEVSPQAPPRSRTIFDELLEGFEDVFARLIAKDEMLGAYDKEEISVGVEHSVNKFIKKAQVVELYFNQMIARRSAGNPQDLLTEEIKDLKAEIHRKDQWIKKMHEVSKKWVDMLQTEEMKKEQKEPMSALETMSANPNFKRK